MFQIEHPSTGTVEPDLEEVALPPPPPKSTGCFNPCAFILIFTRKGPFQKIFYKINWR